MATFIVILIPFSAQAWVYPVGEYESVVLEKTGSQELTNLVLEIITRESEGWDTAKNPNSSAHGLCQIIDSTWNEYATAEEDRYDWEDQLNVCIRILDGGKGIGHWDPYSGPYVLHPILHLVYNN